MATIPEPFSINRTSVELKPDKRRDAPRSDRAINRTSVELKRIIVVPMLVFLPYQSYQRGIETKMNLTQLCCP